MFRGVTSGLVVGVQGCHIGVSGGCSGVSHLLCPYVVFVLYPYYRIMSHPPLRESVGVAILGSVTVTAHSVIP